MLGTQAGRRPQPGGAKRPDNPATAGSAARRLSRLDRRSRTTVLVLAALVPVLVISLVLLGTAGIAIGGSGSVDVQTDPPNQTDGLGPGMHGDLLDMGDNLYVSVSFEYREAGETDWRHVTLDRMSADGDFHEDPNGYAHNDSYVHLNWRIPEGRTITVTYDEAGSGAQLRPYLRSEEYTADGDIDDIWSGSAKDVLSDNETVQLRIEHDGDQVDVYVNDTLEWTATDITEEAVYFSSFESGGTTGENSLRMLQAAEVRDLTGTFDYVLQVGEDLEPDTEYEYRALADDEEGEIETLETDEPVDTLIATETDTLRPTLEGSVEMGIMDEASAWFKYREVGESEWNITDTKSVTESGTFGIETEVELNTSYEFSAVVEGVNGTVESFYMGEALETIQPEDTDTLGPTLRGHIDNVGETHPGFMVFEYREQGETDWKLQRVDGISNVSADGDLHTDPMGFAHDGDYAHWNDPIEPGESVTLIYDEAGSGANLRPYLRNKPYAADGGIDRIWRGTDRDVFSSHERSNVTVTYDGDEVNIYVDGVLEWTASGIDQDEVYFSSYEWSGSSGTTSLRLLGGKLEFDTAQTFNTTLEVGEQLQENATYEYRTAFSTLKGNIVEFDTEEPANTVRVSDENTVGPVMTGNVSLGGLEQATVWFDYRPTGETDWSETDAKTVGGSGQFDMTQPLRENESYEFRAAVNNLTGPIEQFETSRPVNTTAPTQTNTLTPQTHGDVWAFGGLDQAAAWFEYRGLGDTEWRNIILEQTSADGDFWHDPAGYAHDGDYVHVNRGIRDGETMSFRFYEAGSGADLRPYLRDNEYEADGRIDRIWRGSSKDVFTADGETDVTVTHDDDVVEIYVGGSLEWTATGISQETVYFSSYEWSGSSGSDSLRFLGSADVLDSPDDFSYTTQMGHEVLQNTSYEVRAVVEATRADPVTLDAGEPVETVEATELDTHAPVFHGTIDDLGELDEVTAWFEYSEDGDTAWSKTDTKTVTESGSFEIAQLLEANTTYKFRAVAENATGSEIEIETGNPLETVEPTATETLTPIFHGNMTNLGGLDGAGVWFEYRQTGATDWTNLGLSDISADGDFWENPDGYDHDNDYVHVNTPLVENQTHSFRYYEAGSGADFRPHLRDTEYEADGGIDDIWSGSSRDVFESGETHLVGVTYEGETVEITVDGTVEWTADSITSEEVYFSGYEWSGSSGSNSLRFLGEGQRVDTAGSFNETTGLGHDLQEETSYDVRVRTDGATANYLTFTTGNPVETETVSETDGVGTVLHGSVTDIGELEEASVWFDYRIDGTSDWNETDAEVITESGEFTIPQPLASNETYEFRAIAENVTAVEETFDTGMPVATDQATDTDTLEPVMHGNVTSLGGIDEATVWFEYRETGTTEWQQTDTTVVTEEGPFNISQALSSNTEYEFRAHAEAATGPIATFETGAPVETLDPTATDSMTPVLRGNVSDFGGLDEGWVSFQYRESGETDWRNPIFDFVSADGDFWEEPAGYAHDNDYVHINRPILDGQVLTLRYDEAGSGANFRPHLRDSEYEADGGISDIWSGSGESIPSDSEFEVRIEHAGDEVHIYLDDVKEWSAGDMTQDAVYFSSFEWSGSSGSDSLRMAGMAERESTTGMFEQRFQVGQELNANTTYEYRALFQETSGESVEFDIGRPVETIGVTVTEPLTRTLHGDFAEPGQLDAATVGFEFREVDSDTWQQTATQTIATADEFEISHDFQPNRTYEYRAFANGAKGNVEHFTTSDPVETLNASGIDTIAPELHGELNDTGDFDNAPVWFDYRKAGSTEWNQALILKNISTDGDFWEDPRGLAHDNDYAHINRPIAEGDVLYLQYHEAGSGADVRPHLRNSEYEADGGISDIWSGSSRDVLNSNDISWVEVHHVGDEVRIYVDNSREWTATGISEEEVYFSSYEWSGSSESNSLRILGRTDTLDSPGEFNHTLQIAHQLEADTTYEFRAVFEEALGDIKTFETGEPVETVTYNETTPLGRTITGNVTGLGGLDEATAWIDYREMGESEWSESASKPVTEAGEFDIDHEFEPNRTYEFRVAVAEVRGGISSFETGDPVNSLNASGTDTLGPTFRGELLDQGALDFAPVWFEFRETGETTWRHSARLDDLSADGQFWEGPRGYAHDGDYVHLNRPISAGESKTFLYYEAGSGADLRPHLRDSEYEADGGISDIWSGSSKDVFASNDVTYVQVVHDDDEVRIYADGEHEWTANNINENEVYFSGYEWSGSSGSSSLRLLGTQETLDSAGEFDHVVHLGHYLDRNTEYEYRARFQDAYANITTFETGDPVETLNPTETDSAGPVFHGNASLGGLEEATVWFEYREEGGEDDWQESVNKTISDAGEFEIVQPLDAETTYEVRAVAEDVRGDNVTFTTGDPVETLEPQDVDTVTPEFRGNVTDLGGLDEAAVWFEIREDGATEWTNIGLNHTSSDGQWISDPDPDGQDGYSHDGGYAHVNRPIPDGETLRISYIGSGADTTFTPALRDGLQVANGSLSAIWEGSETDTPNGAFDVTVDLNATTVTVSMDVDGEVTEWTASGIEADEVYFSSGESDGETGADSLRFVGVGEVLDTPGNFTRTPGVGALELNRTYDVRAVVEAAGGEPHTFDSHTPAYHGSGTETSPYHITSITEFQFLGHDETEPTLADHFILTNDIEAGDTERWYQGEGFAPIGDEDESFIGTFDGNTHNITNLTIQRPTQNRVGLFGFVESGDARIENVEIERASVYGNESVGILAGRIDDGIILNSSVSGTVRANKQRVGGMVGRSVHADLENRLVATGTVEGGEPGTSRGIGGLVGEAAGRTEVSVGYTRSEVIGDNAGGIVGTTSSLDSHFEEMYSVSTIDGEDGGAIVGIIQASEDTFADSVYWNTEIEADPYGIEEESGWEADWEGLVTDEMLGEAARDNMSELDWEDTWVTVEVPEPGYPRFVWEAGDAVIVSGTVTDGRDGTALADVPVTATPADDSDVTDASGEYSLELFDDLTYQINATAGIDGFTVANTTTTVPRAGQTIDLALEPTFNGSGTADDPYNVSTVEDLQQIRYDLDAHYQLVDDVDADDAGDWFDGDGFEPIGTGVGSFDGSLEGNNYTLSNLTIDRDKEAEVGLFSTIGDGVIENLTVRNVDVAGAETVGTIAGTLVSGTVDRVAVEGSVAGDAVVGGLVGAVGTNGTISNVNATVATTGAVDLGGVVGNNDGTVFRARVTGSVSGGDRVGGIVGNNDGTINRSLATGALSGDDNVGGVAGVAGLDNVTITKSYWDVNATGYDESDGGSPRTTDDLTGRTVMASTMLDFDDGWAVTEEYPRLQWQVDPVADEANFRVSIDNTSQPVVVEETVLVNITVENVGEEADEQLIELLDFDNDVVDDWTVDLDVDESASTTLEWTTDVADAGTDEVAVLSDDHVDRETVAVLGESNYTVSITNTTSPGAGDDLIVSANVTNEGEAAPAQNVTLAIDGSVEDVYEDLVVDANETESISLTWETDADDVGTHEANVSTADDYNGTAVTVREPADYQVEIVDSTEPGPGDEMTVTANVTNDGEVTGEQSVTLAIDETVEDTVEDLVVEPGETESVELTWVPGDDDVGTHEANVSTEDDFDTATVTVLEPAVYEVEIANTTVVAEGEDLTVWANVTNVGEATGEQDVTLAIEDTDEDVETDVVIESGETTAINLTWATDAGDEGDHQANVSTEDDFDTATVTVLEQANFTVEILEASEEVIEGETVDVNASVTNMGDVDGTGTIELLDFDDDTVDSVSIDLDSGENETVSLAWETGDGDAGSDEITVSSGHDEDTVGVSVLANASFAISITDTNAPVVEEETVLVNATVENTGDVAGTDSVELYDFDGDIAHARTLELNASESKAVTFEWETEVGDAGTDEVRVESADDSDEMTITVEELVHFGVTVTDTEAVEEGEVLAVTADVTNTGEETGIQDILLLADETEQDVHADLELASGESESVVLEWQTYPGDAGERTVTVASDDDEDDETATVTERPPITDCETIDQPGEYELGDDITDASADPCLEITALGVTVDGNGHTIDGVDTEGTAIEAASSAANLQIENLAVTNWGSAIHLQGAGGSTIADVSIQDSDRSIYLFDAGNATVVDTSIYADSTTSGTIGIEAISSEEVAVVNTTIEDADEAITLLESPETTIDETTVLAADDGIVIEESDRTNLTTSTVTDSDSAVTILDSNATTVQETTVTDGTTGFDLKDATNATVADVEVLNIDEAGLEIAGQLAATDVTLSQTGGPNATLSFDGQNVTLGSTEDPPDNPDGVPIDRYFTATEIEDEDAPVLNATLQYTDDDVEGLDEDRLAIWQFDEAEAAWSELDTEIDTGANELSVSITDFSTFGAFQEPEPAFLEVEIDEMTDPVVAGETFEATVDFENTGEARADQTVTLEIDQEVVDTVDVEVDGETTESVIFEWNTTDDDLGSQFAIVSSDDDWEWDAFSVVEPGEEDEIGNVTVEIESYTEPVHEGQTFEVIANVTNVGDEEESQRVTLHVEDLWLIDETNVTLAPGESTEVVLEWEIDEGEAGEHNIAVSSEVDADVAHVIVDPGTPATYDVDIVDFDENDQLAITADIENIGDLSGDEEEIWLDHEGDTHDVTTVELEAGETETVELVWDDYPDGGVGESVYVRSPDRSDRLRSEYRIRIEAVNETEDDLEVFAEVWNRYELSPLQNLTLEYEGQVIDSQKVRIGEDVEKNLSFVWADFPEDGVTERIYTRTDDRSSWINAHYAVSFVEVLEGDDLEATVEVENTGPMTGGNQTIELEHDDTVKDSTQVVLAGGESTNVTLIWEDYPDGGATDRLYARSEDSSTSQDSRFSVDILDLDRSDGLELTAEVTNTRDLRETQEIRFIYDESLSTRSRVSTVYGSTMYNGTDVTLDGGESEVITLSWDGYPDDGLRGPVFISSQNNYDYVRSNYRVSIEDIDEDGHLQLTADISNTGQLEPLQDITLEYDGVVRDSTELSVESSETETVTLTWDGYPDEGIVDPSRVYVRSEDRHDSVRSRYRVRVDEVVDNDIAEITTRVRNTGELRSTQDLDLIYDGSVITTDEVALDGGDETYVTQHWDYPDEGAVDPNRVFVSVDHDTDRMRPYFRVDVTDVLEVPGAAVAVSADVRSTSYPWSWTYSDPPIKSTQEIRLETDHEQVNQTEVTLKGWEEKEDIILVWEIEEGDIGGERLWVRSDDTSSSITVPGVIFEVDITETNAPITEGDILEVEADIENTGYEQTTQQISMYMVEDEDDEEGVLVDTTNVTVGPRSVGSVDFEWDTTVGDAGNHFAAIASEDRWDWDWTPVEPEAACRYAGADAIASSPTIVAGVVYVGSDDGHVYALDAETCEQLWSYETGGEVRSSPQVVHETVYVGSGDERVYAIHASNGTVDWSVDTGGPVGSSPTLSDDSVYVGSGDGQVYALDADTGTIEWETDLGSPIESSPTVADETVFVGSDDGKVHALDADSGAIEWSETVGTSVFSSPTVAGDTVYVGSDDDYLYALSTSDGTEEWTFETGEVVDSSPTVVDDVVYVASQDEHVYAINATSGGEVWAFEANLPVTSSPTVAGDMLFVGSGNESGEDAWLFAIEADTGEEHWRFTTGGAVQSSPTVAGDAVYFGSDAGYLSAIETHVVGWSGDSRVDHRTLGHHDIGLDEGPVAAFGVNPPRPVEGDEATFDASGSLGNIQSYEWDSPDVTDFPASGETVNHTFEEAGEYQVELTVTDDLGETDRTADTVEVREPGEFTVDIVETNSPVVENETVEVTAVIENEDANAGEQDVILSIDGTEVDSQLVALGGSDQTTVTFEWETNVSDAGSYTAVVSSEDDDDSAAVVVQSGAAFAVEISDHDQSVSAGTTASVTATVTNLGDEVGTQDVILDIDGDQVDLYEGLELDGGESTEVELEWDTDGAVTGTDYQAVVRTDDDSDEAKISVLDDAVFEISIDNINDPVIEGDRLAVDATVTNTGEDQDTQDVSFRIDDDEHSLRSAIQLDGGESITEQFTWSTETGDAGEYDLEVRTDDDVAGETVTVLEDANYTLRIVDYDDPVEQNETTSVVAEIENRGEVTRTEEVTLAIDGIGVVDAGEWRLPAGETTTVALNWTAGPPDTYDATMAVEAVESSVAIRVEPADPGALMVEAVNTTQTVIVEESVDIDARVSNDGDEAVNDTVVFASNTTDVLESKVVAIDAGETRVLTVSTETDLGDGPAMNLSVTTEADVGYNTTDVVTTGDVVGVVRNEGAVGIAEAAVELEPISMPGLETVPAGVVMTSDNDGDFDRDGVLHGHYRLHATAEDYQAVEHPVFIQAGQENFVAITLVPEQAEPTPDDPDEVEDELPTDIAVAPDIGDPVRVVETGALIANVSDPDGLPIENATVEITAQAGDEADHDDLQQWLVATNEDGRAALSTVETGVYALNATKSAFSWQNATVELDAGETEVVELELVPDHGAILGDVVRAGDGSALADASVRVFDADGEQLEVIETDDDGDFRFDLIPAGEYDLTVERSGYESAEVSNVSVDHGEENIVGTIELEAITEEEEEPSDGVFALHSPFPWLLLLLLIILLVIYLRRRHVQLRN